MTTNTENAGVAAAAELAETIRKVSRRVPPLWTLKNFVAVNPFVGLTGYSVLDAACLMERTGHGLILRSPAEFGRIFDQKPVTPEEYQQAMRVLIPAMSDSVRQRCQSWTVEEWLARMMGSDVSGCGPRVLTVSECVDGLLGSHWSEFLVDEISKWCSSYFDLGQSSWSMPRTEEGLYGAWRRVALRDLNPEAAGMGGFRQAIASFPSDPMGLIAEALAELRIPRESVEDFIHREWLSISGWSSHAQYMDRQEGMSGRSGSTLTELLAVRLAYDLALHRQFSQVRSFGEVWSARWQASRNVVIPDSFVALEIAQAIVENRFRARLLNDIRRVGSSVPAQESRAQLHAFFCIDVRSEVYRRWLETVSPSIQTSGFAGFFGMPISLQRDDSPQSRAQCPVLLSPKFPVREMVCTPASPMVAVGSKLRGETLPIEAVLDRMKSSAVSCFSFVELLGLGYGLAMARSSLKPFLGAEKRGQSALKLGAPGNGDDGSPWIEGLELDTRVQLAEGALRNMGLIRSFALTILLCGHGGSSVNNPHGSGLDCGACGGYPGDANARVAAILLNQPEVRAGLAARGIDVPADTVFLAGFHDTTTDRVTLFDRDVPSWLGTRDWRPLKKWLDTASAMARCERSVKLGLREREPSEVQGSVDALSLDWGEVRPEWALAGNAAFVAAPRRRTQGLDLAGRVFLHDYDARKDPSNALLELILVAPVVVASWINLQYYASTVNHGMFGSGNKLLHNVVGTFGVWEGNGGDLKAGLPWQSIHDGKDWVHEPLRLSVFLEAEQGPIEEILRRHESVSTLVEHGWIRLLRLEPGGDRAWHYAGRGHWVEVGDPLSSLPRPQTDAKHEPTKASALV